MTDATHTQGPWRIVTDGISHWIEIEPNKIALIKAKKADRDLIAAAPDLLAALELMNDMFADHAQYDDEGYETAAIVAAQAAIAKAKGY